MSFERVLHDVDSAVRDLRRTADEATGWSDQQRSRFDAERLKPLLRVGDQLTQALRRADEQLKRAATSAMRNK